MQTNIEKHTADVNTTNNNIIDELDHTILAITFMDDPIVDEDDGDIISSPKPYLAGEDDDHKTNEPAMTDWDRDWLKDLEELVSYNLDSLIFAGKALHHIKSSKLYRDTHKSFAAYCAEKFDLPHINNRPNTPVSVQVPRGLAKSIKSFVNENPDGVTAMACLITSLAKQSIEKE